MPDRANVKSDIRLTAYMGASVHWPSSCATAEFELPFSGAMTAASFCSTAAAMAAGLAWDEFDSRSGEVSFIEAVAAVARLVAGSRGGAAPEVSASVRDGGRALVILPAFDPETAKLVLQAALQLAYFAFGAGPGSTARPAGERRRFDALLPSIRNRLPDYTQRALMAAAAERGIPAYPLIPGSGLFMIGEGARATHLKGSAGQATGVTGEHLARNKLLGNMLVRTLGFPGVSHVQCVSEADAEAAALQMGFPVVVKPLDRGKGEGVAPDLRAGDGVRQAFRKAAPLSGGTALVEKHVAGDAYRLTVFDGVLMRASCLEPPVVTGDGCATLRQLIEAEDAARPAADLKAGLLFPLRIDDNMLDAIAGQGLNLDSRPAEGRRIVLRKTSNLHTGGRIVDATDRIHPENRAMAETIARALHIDAAGVDFITPAIERPWHEVPCAVIEINTNPGIGDVIARRVIAHRFPDRADGRIPSVIVLGGSFDELKRLEPLARRHDWRLAIVTAERSEYDGHRRAQAAARLDQQLMGAMLQPDCGMIAVACSMDDIRRRGFPGRRFHLCLVHAAHQPAAAGRELLLQGADRVMKYDGEADLAARVEEGLRACRLIP